MLVRFFQTGVNRENKYFLGFFTYLEKVDFFYNNTGFFELFQAIDILQFLSISSFAFFSQKKRRLWIQLLSFRVV